MKNPYDISSVVGGMDAAKIAALSGVGSVADSFGQFALEERQRQQQAIDLFGGGQAARQMRQAVEEFNRQDLNVARMLEGQVKSWLMPSYDHLSHLAGIVDPSITRYAQELEDQSARYQDLYTNAFHGFDQVQQAIHQLDLSNSLVSQVGAGATVEKLLGATAFAGSVFDTRSFADSAAKQLKMLGWGAYEDQIRSLVGGIDFDTLQEMASSAGVVLDQELDDEDEDYDQPSPSTALIQSAIERAELGAVRQAVDAMFAEAIRKSAEQSPQAKKQIPAWVLVVLLPLLYTLAGIILQPLFARWLAERDAQALSAKTPSEVQTHKLPSRFADIVAVKPEVLPIRRGPSTTEGIVLEAKRGQMLEVLRRKGLWARVRYVDALHDGISVTGWVKLKQTQRIEDETVRMIWCSLLGAQGGSDGCDPE